MEEKNIKLKVARVEKDLSQDELAKKIGVSRQTINMIEKGKYNPSLSLCLTICWELDKKLDDLFWKDCDRGMENDDHEN